MPRGPGIADHVRILRELEQDGLVKITREPSGPYFVHVFETAQKVEVSEREARVIAKALEAFKALNATESSDASHEMSWTWNNTQNEGEPLQIYLDLLDDERRSEMKRNLDRARAVIDGIFG